jgi:hypothetical protein
MEVKSQRPDAYTMEEIAPNFGETFRALETLMTIQEGKLRKKSVESAETANSQPISSSNPGSKRPRPTSLTNLSAKRPKVEQNIDAPEEPTTPDQPTKSSDPKFSSSTEESQGEPATEKLIYILLMNTLKALKREFGTIGWQRSGHKVQLAQTYTLKHTKILSSGALITCHFF